MNDLPKLLKARQLHSRIFAVILVLILLVTRPESGRGVWYSQTCIWLGYTLVILGAFGRVYCSTFIGGRKNDVVVRDGPFSIVRNPLYVFSFIAMVGIGLESKMLSLLAVLILSFIFYYPQVVAKEEAFLTHKFGEAYQAYLCEVPRWWPNFRLWRESQQLDAKPAFIRKTAMDAAIFFLPLPCFVIINKLQSAHVFPIWLILP